jgi:hypothetical protein
VIKIEFSFVSLLDVRGFKKFEIARPAPIGSYVFVSLSNAAALTFSQ